MGKSLRTIVSLISVLGVFLVVGCGGSTREFPLSEVQRLEDEIEVQTVSETALDTALVKKAVSRIRGGKYGEVHSLLIYTDGALVVEEYFPGYDYRWDAPKHYGEVVDWDARKMHHLQSVTKSITSACIAVAVERGYIGDLDASIFEYLPGTYSRYKKDGKEYITIRHLLTMTSGLQWDEWSSRLSSRENDIINIWYHGDAPLDFILQRPLVHAPGEEFIYAGANMVLLGEIIEYASGMDINEFSGKYLFGPLGIQEYDWWLQYENGTYAAAGCLRLTPRSMLKIGLLYLNDGIWNGERILPEGWVEKSSTNFHNNSNIKVPGEDLGSVGYGFTWWQKTDVIEDREIKFYFALGWGGQKIIVVPEFNSVIVMNGANFTKKVKQYRILRKYILPAFI